MKKAPRTLVIKSLPAAVKGRSLSVAKRAAIVKKVSAKVVVKNVSKLHVKDTATGGGKVSFSKTGRAA
jgi:hypothetical protein